MQEPQLPDFFQESHAKWACEDLCWRRVEQRIQLAFPTALVRPASGWNFASYQFLCAQHNQVLAASVVFPDGHLLPQFPSWCTPR